MKKIRTATRLLALFCLLMFFSCKKVSTIKEDPAFPEVSSTLLNDPNFVPISTAIQAARQAPMSPLTLKLSKNASGAAKKEIKNSITVPDDANPSYYIFNYVEGGYVIVAADKRVEPILAYCDKGAFSSKGRISQGLGQWLSVNNKNMILLRTKTNLVQPKAVEHLWKDLLVADSTVANHPQKLAPPPPPCEDTYTSYVIGPLLATEWAQGYPYNQLCPAGNYSYGHTPTGCVATAMAQVMYYWKYPTYFNWANMPTTTTYQYNYDVAALMIYAGVSVDMEYSDSGSAPYTDIFSPSGISCTDALRNSFGYGSASEGSYDWSSVVSNLNYNEPVLLSATTDDHQFLWWEWGYDGHEWVCDGYEEYSYSICPTPDLPNGMGGTYLYLHMNWGWNELGASNVDGWYAFSGWSVYNGGIQNYQYNQAMTYNIHP